MSQIIQVSFIIPDEVIAGLNAGVLSRFGGIIRYATGPKSGSIFSHLKPVDTNAQNSIVELSKKALSIAKAHPVGTLVVLTTFTVAAGSFGTYLIIKKHVPKDINAFRKELMKYLKSIQNGELSKEQINALLCSIEKLKMRKDFNDISVKLSMSEMLTIMQYLNEYTKKLSQDNAVDVGDNEFKADMPDNIVISLENHLNAQKKVFELVS